MFFDAVRCCLMLSIVGVGGGGVVVAVLLCSMLRSISSKKWPGKDKASGLSSCHW